MEKLGRGRNDVVLKGSDGVKRNSLDPSCVTERGLRLQSVSVHKDRPKALSSLVCVSGVFWHRSCPTFFLEPGMSPWLRRGNAELTPFTCVFVGKPYVLLLLS